MYFLYNFKVVLATISFMASATVFAKKLPLDLSEASLVCNVMDLEGQLTVEISKQNAQYTMIIDTSKRYAPQSKLHRNLKSETSQFSSDITLREAGDFAGEYLFAKIDLDSLSEVLDEDGNTYDAYNVDLHISIPSRYIETVDLSTCIMQ